MGLKKWNIGIILVGIGVAGAFTSALAGTPVKTIYVHGMATTAAIGNERYECQDRPTCDRADTWIYGQYEDSVHVGWKSHLNWKSYGPLRMLAILDKYCRTSYCDIIAHSAGTLVSGYVLDNFGSQYKIRRVIFLGAAQGGSELATVGEWLTLGLASGIAALTPSYTRGAYDHNETAGNVIYDHAGDCSIGDPLVLGGDDGVVPLHSACAYRSAFLSYKCNGGKVLSGLKLVEVEKWDFHRAIEHGCYGHKLLKKLEFQKVF